MMPPPTHIIGMVNMARMRIEKQLDQLLHMFSSDGPVILMLNQANCDLKQKLEMWTFVSQTFIEYMAPRLKYDHFEVFHPDPTKSMLQNNIDGVSANRELFFTLSQNLYSPNVDNLYSLEELEKLLTDFIKCIEAHLSSCV